MRCGLEVRDLMSWLNLNDYHGMLLILRLICLIHVRLRRLAIALIARILVLRVPLRVRHFQMLYARPVRCHVPYIVVLSIVAVSLTGLGKE